jgi:hypothetical protein
VRTLGPHDLVTFTIFLCLSMHPSLTTSPIIDFSQRVFRSIQRRMGPAIFRKAPIKALAPPLFSFLPAKPQFQKRLDGPFATVNLTDLLSTRVLIRLSHRFRSVYFSRTLLFPLQSPSLFPQTKITAVWGCTLASLISLEWARTFKNFSSRLSSAKRSVRSRMPIVRP